VWVSLDPTVGSEIRKTRAAVIFGHSGCGAVKAALAPRVQQGRLKVLGGVYDLRPGTVSLLD
jgi:carbonic anhydrase